MKIKKLLALTTKLAIISLIGTHYFFSKNQVLSVENNKEPLQEYIRRLPNDEFYILGVGDKLKLEVSEDSETLDQVFTIDGQGTSFLKRLKKIYIKGLTIKELTNILNKEYSKFVLNPDVQLTVLSYRPVKVYVDGEVVNPGIYVLPGSSSPLESQEFTGQSSVENNDNTNAPLDLDVNVFFPSLIDFLRKSGGITEKADLQNIKITRINNISDGGGRLETSVNLLKTIELRDLTQNLRIIDGDTIKVEKNEIPAIEQITKAIQSNINPKFISVLVAGRVENPGQIKVNKSAVLNDAIQLAGGGKVLKGPINFLRYKNDGTIDRRKFKYNSKTKRGAYKNPYLRDGDLVYVGKSRLNKTSEVLTEITNPLQGIVSAYSFYKLVVE